MENETHSESNYKASVTVALTLSFAVFGAVGPSCGSDEAQLAAEHVGVLDREVVVADRPPLAFVEELYPALVVFSGIS